VLRGEFPIGVIPERPDGRSVARWMPVTRQSAASNWRDILPLLQPPFSDPGSHVYPVPTSIWLSLLEKHSCFPQERFVGLENYRYLWTDPEFWSSLWLGSSIRSDHLFQIVLGVASARILNEPLWAEVLFGHCLVSLHDSNHCSPSSCGSGCFNDLTCVNYWLLAMGHCPRTR